MVEAVFIAVNAKRGEFMILGLTGGIASGKTTVSHWFHQQGVTVLDADQMNHQLLNSDLTLINQIAEVFSKDAIKNGKIDREFIGKIVFNDKEKRIQLEKLIHPVIYEEMKKQIRLHQNESLIVIDVPLLFETNFDQLCDKTMVVYVTKETQLKRLMKRNNYSELEALKRVNSQMPLDEKVSKASYVINNNGTLDDTYKQLENIYKEILGV